MCVCVCEGAGREDISVHSILVMSLNDGEKRGRSTLNGGLGMGIKE